jgi:PPOX class probable F420-dependent enzyme
MQKMPPDECRRFLLERARTAKLATVRADGRPHVVPVWFDLDGDTLVFTTWHKSVKAVNLRRDPRACLCVDDDAPPFAFVQVEGKVAMSQDADDLKYWATRIAARYMGVAQAEAYGKRNSVEGEVLARVTAVKITGRKNVAGW